MAASCYAFGVTSHFVEGILLPFLAAMLAGVVIVFFSGGLNWPVKKHLTRTVPLLVVLLFVSWLVTRDNKPEVHLTLAGTIVDAATSNPIGQAAISLADMSEHTVSEDNGNFWLDLTGKISQPRIRVHVTKDGYSPFDGSVQLPAGGFVIQLHHL
jgi:hypothetical protein